jgi:hypothetical protein
MTSAQLSGIGCTFCAAALIRQICGGGRHPDPLGVNFTVQGFTGLIGGASDAIVPVASALDGFSAVSTFTQVFAAVHSGGALSLGFNPPTLLDGVVIQVGLKCNRSIIVDRQLRTSCASLFEQ